MRYMTEQQAAAEVATWKMKKVNLKPALVTRESLWNSYTTQNKDLAASICETTIDVASEFLRGSASFNLLDWIADAIVNAPFILADAVVGTVREKGVENIAGAFLTEYDNSYKKASNQRFAIKLVNGFLTIITATTGGTLTAFTAGAAAAVTAIAIVAWIGENEEAKKMERWGILVEGMMENYNKIRQKRVYDIEIENITQNERLVMSNALNDLRESGEIKTFILTQNGKAVARMDLWVKSLSMIETLLNQVDSSLAGELYEIDLAEFYRAFPDLTRAYWNSLKPGTDAKVIESVNADVEKVKKNIIFFMKKRIATHIIPDEVAPNETLKTTWKN